MPMLWNGVGLRGSATPESVCEREASFARRCRARSETPRAEWKYSDASNSRLLISRPVRVEHLTPSRQGVIVHPSDTDEGLTAEMLGATQVLEYDSLAKRVNALRPATRAIGIKKIAKALGLSDRALRAIVNQDILPHKSTIEKLEAALERLR